VILLIEEMDAPLAREEANLRQLQLMGIFDRVSGLIVGKPERVEHQGAPFGYDQLILEIIGQRSYPVVSDFDCGHTHPMLTLAQWTTVTLHATSEYAVSVTIEEAMVAT
jgi:muramoyltetrapeptide carboxypeptidase LdcA involved in peptidoglycan recycling